jgi:hypothetical protein
MQDREISYVQASRARGETRFYIDRAAAGKDFAAITAAMDRTRQKNMALELLEPKEAEHPLEQDQDLR